MPDLSKRQRYERLRSALWLERSSFDAHWRDIADYLFPMKPRFTVTDRNRGDRRNLKIIDSTAKFAAHTLRSGLHAGLTSPARPWMKLSTPDPGLTKFKPVQAWLFDVTQRMLTVFQLSNLYKALPLIYGDMGVFGTAAMAVLDDPGLPGQSSDLFRCYPYPIGSYALGVDARGLATTFVREYTLTVGQLVETFGGRDGEGLARGQDPDWSRFSRTVKNLWDEAQYETQVPVCWIVTPNRDYDSTRSDLRRFPWVSCHFEKDATGADEDRVLREKGFLEFPILAPCWEKSAEETYGTDCPGMTALGDIKQLQIEQKRKGQAIEKLVNPPLVGPSALRTQKVSLIAGDTTYVDAREGMQGLKPIHEVKPDLSAMVLDIQEVQFRINQAFYTNLFLMLANSDRTLGADRPTAREIEERHEEKLLALGPVLESTNDELLDPLVDRVFAMMQRAGLIPEAPPELEGVDLTVEYVSILAQAQKLVSVVAQDRFLASTVPLIEAFPEMRHVLNADAAARTYQDALGVDPSLVRSPEEVTARVQAEQQAVAQQAQAEQFQRVAAGTKALGDTEVQDDSALSRLVEGVQVGV